MRKVLFIAFLNVIFTLHSNEGLAYTPWYTGSILSYSGKIVPKYIVSIQPLLLVNTSYGNYKNNFTLEDIPNEVSINPYYFFFYGINDLLDMQFTLQTISNFTQAQSTTNLGDISLLFGIQLVKGTKTRPYVRLLIQETFPTGKYNRLDPIRNQTDIAGTGSFITSFGFATEKIYDWFYYHPVRIRWNFLVNIPSATVVEGVNFYGGAPNTKGKAKSGTSFYILLSPEISITKKWAFALDITYQKELNGSFSGNKGNNSDGSEAVINIYQQDSFQLAPALEYSFNSKIGVLAGVWFTVFGRNSDAFVSAAVSAVLTF